MSVEVHLHKLETQWEQINTRVELGVESNVENSWEKDFPCWSRKLKRSPTDEQKRRLFIRPTGDAPASL